MERELQVTKEQNEEVKKLLTLMGVPVVEAPCEAEAQCAALVKSGKVRTIFFSHLIRGFINLLFQGKTCAQKSVLIILFLIVCICSNQV